MSAWLRLILPCDWLRARHVTEYWTLIGWRLIEAAATIVFAQVLVPEASWSPSEASLLKHVFLSWVNGPVVTLAWSTKGLGQLEETLIERQVMSYRILPALIRSPEERKFLLEELINLRECELLAGDGLDGHDNEGDVAIGRLLLSPHT